MNQRSVADAGSVFAYNVCYIIYVNWYTFGGVCVGCGNRSCRNLFQVAIGILALSVFRPPPLRHNPRFHPLFEFIGKLCL